MEDRAAKHRRRVLLRQQRARPLGRGEQRLVLEDVRHEEQAFCVSSRGLRRRHHRVLELVGGLREDAGRVRKHELVLVARDDAEDAVPRGLGFGRCDAEVLAEDGVGDGGPAGRGGSRRRSQQQWDPSAGPGLRPRADDPRRGRGVAASIIAARSADFPTLGEPTMPTKPARNVSLGARRPCGGAAVASNDAAVASNSSGLSIGSSTAGCASEGGSAMLLSGVLRRSSRGERCSGVAGSASSAKT